MRAPATTRTTSACPRSEQPLGDVGARPVCRLPSRPSAGHPWSTAPPRAGRPRTLAHEPTAARSRPGPRPGPAPSRTPARSPWPARPPAAAASRPRSGTAKNPQLDPTSARTPTPASSAWLRSSISPLRALIDSDRGASRARRHTARRQPGPPQPPRSPRRRRRVERGSIRGRTGHGPDITGASRRRRRVVARLWTALRPQLLRKVGSSTGGEAVPPRRTGPRVVSRARTARKGARRRARGGGPDAAGAGQRAERDRRPGRRGRGAGGPPPRGSGPVPPALLPAHRAGGRSDRDPVDVSGPPAPTASRRTAPRAPRTSGCTPRPSTRTAGRAATPSSRS